MVRRGGNISVDLYLFVLLHKTKFMNKIKFEGCQVGDNSAKSIKRGHKKYHTVKEFGSCLAAAKSG